MGNCIVLEEKVVKVMKTDGKILEYKAPMKVHQVLSEFSGHALSDSSLPETFHLHQDVKLLGGNLYYLVPLPPLPSPKKKKVRFSDHREEEKEGDHGQGTGNIVRIKLVISKQQLQELLQKGGISVHDMVSQLQGKQTTNDHVDNCKGWKPELESIPEVD
ncbi:hypothetical protein LWI29_026532 [Acer saccharum]|uniref:Uncharacterized protein n=1 Tax=Acer saccharum TaxID=4024 RepID=A0AA39S722_ACESA|nr:hypothetical protein LWI29_026532 [Acer saccharum]